MNSNYTDIWTSQFSESEMVKYNQKFFRRIEKNMKHKELVEFISRFHKKNLSWLDFPVGPGRLFDSLRPDASKTFGADISEEFLGYNQSRGWKVFKRDINHFDFPMKFDVITCTNTLFAFPNNKEIMRNLVNCLAPGGVFITDLVNKDHLIVSENACGKYQYGPAYSFDEIPSLAKDFNCTIAAVEFHDYYDNRFMVRIFEKCQNSVLFGRAYKLLNIIYFKLDLYLLFKHFRPKNKEAYIKYLVAFRKNS
jgi:SAM-dependent methyltransferase